jgi:hypothetical protein
MPAWTAAAEGSPDAAVLELPARDELPSTQINIAPTVLPNRRILTPFAQMAS